ncbi:hypothetical protein OAN96_00305 [Candidatus Gracilibacteria bacterium]|nr:hypothetical protein [Candidatus Gracilibacteria bacterium]
MNYQAIIRPEECVGMNEYEECHHEILVATLKDLNQSLNRSNILQEKDIPLDEFNLDLLDLIELYRYIEDFVASNYENEIMDPLIPLRNPLITEFLEADGSKMETDTNNVTKLLVILLTDLIHYKQVCPYDERIEEACEVAIKICSKYTPGG